MAKIIDIYEMINAVVLMRAVTLEADLFEQNWQMRRNLTASPHHQGIEEHCG